MVLEGICLEGVIEPAIARVGMAVYMKWQPNGQRSPRQFLALVSVSVICFDLKSLKNGFFLLNFFCVSPLRGKI